MILTVLALVLLSDEQPDKNTGFAQEPLEPLMRRRLPAFERGAPIRIDAGRLNSDQQLPGRIASTQLGNRPGRAQSGVVIWQSDVQFVR